MLQTQTWERETLTKLEESILICSSAVQKNKTYRGVPRRRVANLTDEGRRCCFSVRIDWREDDCGGREIWCGYLVNFNILNPWDFTIAL